MGIIGNSILRSQMAAVQLEQLVGLELISTGKVTAEEYQGALREATDALRRTRTPSASLPLEKGENGIFFAGSWAIHSLFCLPEGTCQLLEAWARDACERSTEQHSHDADEYIVALDGKTLIVLNGVPCTLRKNNVLQVPAGAMHSTTPLGQDAHLLFLLVPAVPEFDFHRTQD